MPLSQQSCLPGIIEKIKKVKLQESVLKTEYPVHQKISSKEAAGMSDPC
jgi:hypothetical protein